MLLLLLTNPLKLQGFFSWQGRLNNVLVDVCVNMDKEPPPTGFSLIDLTVDSSKFVEVEINLTFCNYLNELNGRHTFPFPT